MQVTYFLATLANFIIDKYLTENSRCVFLFKDSNSDVFEYHGKVSLVVVDVTGNKFDSNLVFQEYGCQGFIIQSKHPVQIFNQLEYDMKFQKDRFNLRKYLILVRDMSYNSTQVFHSEYLQYVSDFLMIYPRQSTNSTNLSTKPSWGLRCKNEEYALLTHNYVGKEQNASLVLLDFWFSANQSFLVNTPLYPNKIRNQEKRVLRIAHFTYEPYSIADDDGVAAGTEHNAIMLYVKKHNMTFAKILEQDDKWGIVFENFTGMGIMGRVVEDEADLAFTALYTWEHEYGFMDFTMPLVRTGITCLVPAPVLASGWLTPLFPFSLELWIATTTSFIVCFIFIFGVTNYLEKPVKRRRSKRKQIKNFGGSIWSVYSMFMLQGVAFSNRGVGRALKYSGFAFILSLMITSAYSGGLASVMTVPRFVDAIETVDDLVSSGIKWGATDEAWTYSMLNDETPEYKVIVSNFVVKSSEELLEILKSQTRMGFSLERLPSGHYAIGEYITEDVVQSLRLMREDLYWEHCIFMLRKNSVLLESVNDLILRISASGLHIYWESMAAQTHMDLEVQNILHYYSGNPSEQIIQKLKWMHVQGAFAILGIGHTIGLICFVLEVTVWKISSI